MIDATRLIPLTGVVDRDSFRALREAWAGRATGHMCDDDGLKVALVAGNVTQPGALDTLAAGLCAPGLSFCSHGPPQGGMSVPIGGLMFEAARRVAKPEKLRDRLDVLISEGRHYEATQHRLAIPAVTRAVMSQVLRTTLTLREGLRAEGIGIGVVVDDLAALRALRILRVDRVPRRPEDLSLPSLSGASIERLGTDRHTIRQRLEREWALFENATSWAVLGLRPGLSEQQIQAAGARMLRRYQSFLDTPGLKPDTRDLGDRLLARAQKALERLAKDPSAVSTPGEPSSHHAVQMGWHKADQGDWAAARDWFLVGRQAPRRAAEAMAGLGWVEILDPMNSDRARQDGLELIELAAQVAPGDARVRWVLAQARSMRGD